MKIITINILGKEYTKSVPSEANSEDYVLYFINELKGLSFTESNNTVPISMIDKVKEFADLSHRRVNQRYDKQFYIVHLDMVVKIAEKFSYLLNDTEKELAICASYGHDILEDTGNTVGDLNKRFTESLTDICYKLTNEKGKNRDERANSKYYTEICESIIAIYVKMCDRYANMLYSKQNGSSMYSKYKKEYSKFKKALYHYKFYDMWTAMEKEFDI